jgi:hypothetical protein
MKFAPLLAAALVLSVAPSFSSADESSLKADEQIVMQQVLNDKRAVFANNLNLTEQESKAFWPIYDEYEKELKAHNDKVLDLLNIYARDYDTFTDDQAISTLKVRMQLQSDRLAMKHKYTRKVAAVLPPKKALRFAQIETRVNNIVESNLLSIVPLAR